MNHEEALAAIQRVRDLHYTTLYTDDECVGCGHYYPCPTIEALGGEQE
jgi:hypothetical protein